MRNISKHLALLSIIFVVFICHSCTKDTAPGQIPPGNTCDTSIQFIRDVKPMMVAYCAKSGCHDATNHLGGYDLTTAIDNKKGMNGTMICIIKAPCNSKPQMPTDVILPDSTITHIVDTLQKWQRQGFCN
jgi:hypothetical protein